MGQAIVGIALPDRGRGFVNYNVLFEQDAINGEIHVEGCCVEAFKQLVQYYKSFWLQKIGVNMGCPPLDLSHILLANLVVVKMV